MRRQDKYKTIRKANMLLEESYLKSKGLLKEQETPIRITVKLTNKLKTSYNLSNVPSDEIVMNAGTFYKLGNTRATETNEVEFFYAKYRPEINEIHIMAYAVPNELFNYFDGESMLLPGHVQRIQQNFVEKGKLRVIPYGDPKFESIEVGQIDDDGYFQIVSVG